MAKEGFWPLYEGKHIDQFLVDAKPVERWVCLEKVEKKSGKPPSTACKLAFRDIASNTNERTCIAAVLPQKSYSGNTLAILDVPGVEQSTAATVMNSFAFDFITRLRTAGTHVNWTYLSRVAVPLLADCRNIPVIETVSVADAEPPEHDEAYFEAVWQANFAVAQAYGLTAEDLAHVLSTFPVFARKHPDLQQFLVGQLKQTEFVIGK